MFSDTGLIVESGGQVPQPINPDWVQESDGEETDDNFIVDEGTEAAGWPLMRVKEAVFLKELLWGDNLPECLLVFGLHDTGKSTVQECIFLPKVIFSDKDTHQT